MYPYTSLRTILNPLRRGSGSPKNVARLNFVIKTHLEITSYDILTFNDTAHTTNKNCSSNNFLRMALQTVGFGIYKGLAKDI